MDKVYLEEIRRESLDVYNRLRSIEKDATFVRQVHEEFRLLPILPNLRCGAWYVDPEIATPQPAYFKSTDGHFGNWGFSLRRPNLHLLPLIIKHSGLILVDSTRAGKRIPDALSKTIPIWCAVLNRAVLLRSNQKPSDGWDTELYTPPGAVSAQEHAQIALHIDEWVNALAGSTYSLPELPRPLRPLWITPDTSTYPSLGAHTPFLPIICVSASKVTTSGAVRRVDGFVYVQGSGDDHELWGHGLTPSIFWLNHTRLLSAHRAELLDIIHGLVHGYRKSTSLKDIWRTPPTPITHVGGTLLICSTADLPAMLPAPLPQSEAQDKEDTVAFLVISEDFSYEKHPQLLLDPVAGEVAHSPKPAERNAPNLLLRLQLNAGKRGQHIFLHDTLPKGTAYARDALASGRRIVFACDTGTDASVGVALAVIALFFSDTGKFTASTPSLNKQLVQSRLQWIIASWPQANPSRATLKRVHDFLLAPAAFRS